MQTDTTIYEQTAHAFASLDFSVEDGRLAELEAERAGITAAMVRVHDRRVEIDTALAGWRNARRDAEKDSARVMADALVDGATLSEAVAPVLDIEALKEESAALVRTLAELERRQIDLGSEIKTVRMEAAGKAALAAQPLADALRAKAKRAAEELLECYAGLQALSTSVGAAGREVGQARNAAAGCIGENRLLSWRQQIPVPNEVADVLDALPPNPSLPANRVSVIPAPEDREHLNLIATISMNEAAKLAAARRI